MHESNYNADQKHSDSQEVLFSSGTENEDGGDPDWASVEEDSTSDKVMMRKKRKSGTCMNKEQISLDIPMCLLKNLFEILSYEGLENLSIVCIL